MDTLINNDPYASGFRVEDAPRIDGTGHNLSQPSLGGAGTRYRQLNPTDYGDDFTTPAGADRPSAREISNRIAKQTTSIPDPRGLTTMSWIFGQFINHEFDQAKTGTEPFPIPVPDNDISAATKPALSATLGNFKRDSSDTDSGSPFNVVPRAQINTATSWIDGSVIYSTNSARLNFLRTFEGGKLKTSEGNLLPLDTTDFPNATTPRLPKSNLFLAGDSRANIQIGLTALQTLWVREHNRLADELADAHPTWNDEQIFQRARAIVIGQLQAITYNEYAPALLGEENVTVYNGYDPSTVSQSSLTFATGAFRVPHSQITNDFLLLDSNGQSTGRLGLVQGSFNPALFQNPNLMDELLRGSTVQLSEQIDLLVVDGIRDTFSDLIAEDIQRGRDHGLPDYNTLRDVLERIRPTGRSFPLVTSFDQISSDPDIQATLSELYDGDVNNIDMLTGLAAEDLPRDRFGNVTSSMGPTAAEVVRVTLQRLRDGDRFFYKNPILNGGLFTSEEIEEIDATKLSDIIRRNTNVQDIQDNVFFAPTTSSVTGNTSPLFGGSSNDNLLLSADSIISSSAIA
jgi:peroxidase